MLMALPPASAVIGGQHGNNHDNAGGHYATNVLFVAGLAVIVTLALSMVACKYYNDYETSLKNRTPNSLNRRIRPKKIRISTNAAGGGNVVFTQKLWLGRTRPTTLLDKSLIVANGDGYCSDNNNNDDSCDDEQTLLNDNHYCSVAKFVEPCDIEITSPEIFV